MQRKLALFILLSLVVSGCQMRRAGRLLGGGGPRGTFAPPTATVEDLPTLAPTATPAPPPTITPSPLPDFASLGLPSESAGTTALDFAADGCKAKWSNSNDDVTCSGSVPAPSAGYVVVLGGGEQGLPVNTSVLLTFPPQKSGDTLSGRYPAFMVQKGDRFRAVLACQPHTSCDVEFGLEYYDANGTAGLAHWSYLFADEPKVVDFSLDGIAGLTIQFRLLVRRHGEGRQDYAVWILPHVYRPAP